MEIYGPPYVITFLSQLLETCLYASEIHVSVVDHVQFDHRELFENVSR